uniref:Uncharacterized protein HLSG-g5 n=1 Tax=Haemaphysalis longicornis TaxID=44386 RepID=Q4R196_HAELO|nr:hypothetical protein [Haemaphysalis longicornis]
MRPIILAFIVALVAAACRAGSVPTIEDLRESLNTSQPIWKKIQNYTAVYNCTRATKISLNETMYIFNQTYLDGKNETTHRLYGKLRNRTAPHGPVMRVSKISGGPGIPYRLKYWNVTEKCGVLKFRVNGTVGCEMHMWNSSVDGNAPSCEKKYKQFCKGKNYTVYEKSCKSGFGKTQE